VLFPLATDSTTRLIRGRPALSAALQVAAVAVAAIMLLYRVAVIPAWDCVYAEDGGIFLVQALRRPWHPLIPYNGYLQFVPRLIAQGVSLLPLTRAAFLFAVTGAIITAGCALFTYHASAGYIQSRALRFLLGAALILLPVAPLEVADSGVNTPWYIMAALFWAALWRPRTRGGKAAAALVAFAATSSTPMAIAFAPLLAIRAYALRDYREHAVTAGWLAGWPLQVYAIAETYGKGTQRVGKLAPLGKSIAYYLHTVVLRAFGWHLSWDLISSSGLSGATLITAAALAVMVGLAMTQGRQARVFAILAVATGFVYTVFASTITSYVVYQAAYQTPRLSFEPASRYSVVPILLLDTVPIVATDMFARRHGGLLAAIRSLTARSRPAPTARSALALTATVIVLVGILSAGWVTDYSYPTQRTSNGPWQPVAVAWLDACRHRQQIDLPEWSGHQGLDYVDVPCSRLVP
jgi:hypothetical protein